MENDNENILLQLEELEREDLKQSINLNSNMTDDEEFEEIIVENILVPLSECSKLI